MSFWGELKRRNVFKVGAAYVIVAWLIVQVANTFFPILHLPDWAVTLIACFLILGFPIALIHAWAYEVTPDGIKRTKEVPLADSITHLTGKRLNYILIGIIVLAVAYILIDNLYLDRRVVETEVVSTVAKQTPTATDVEEAPKTIAVLPFVNLSSDPEQEFFVDGLSEEILNSLAKLQDLRVIARTSSFSFKGTDKKIQEIADELGANHILEGSVRKAGNELRIAAQLIRAADGIHLWSETYDRKLEDIFFIQEDIATTVADELKLTLGIEQTFKQLGGTDNVEAYELYLAAKGQLYNPGESWFHALESIEAAIELDPDFALAWALEGFYQVGLTYLTEFSEPDSREQYEKAKKAVQKALELEPDLPEAYAVLGHINLEKGGWIEAEYAIRKALAVKTEQLWGLELTFSGFYAAIGYLEKARNFYEEILRDDPLSMTVREFYIFNLVSLGDVGGAEAAFQRGKTLIGDQWETDIGSTAISILLASDEALTRDEIVYSSPVADAVKNLLGVPEKALSELRRLYKTESMPTAQAIEIPLWAVYFDDADFAFEVIEKRTVVNNSLARYFWHPVMHEVRQLPRFKEFVREIGLVDYWEQFGWPDLCKPTGDGDFECD